MLSVASPAVAQPADSARPLYAGRTVASVLDEIRATGVTIAYSSRLVPLDMLVTEEPESTEYLAIAQEILTANALTLQWDEGIYLVVRTPAHETLQNTRKQTSENEAPTIERITVSASRYEISRDVPSSNIAIDQRTIQNMPDVGEDPVRITHRLPGAAASGASARAHFRGGEQGEVGIVLNGHRLFDPFHVRDYQNIFSAIDARAIDGVEVYTGGFPVQFGDRMSGLVLMESLDTGDRRVTEIGLSVFNTSLLFASSKKDKRWLVSARRGNLDLIIDPKFGEPSYYDVFAQFQSDLTPAMRFSANGLYADDLVTVVLEADPDERESASSRTRNTQVWLQLDNEWSEQLSSRTALSFVSYANSRVGELRDVEKIVADVTDIRDLQTIGLRQDWMLRSSDTHLMRWGFDFSVGDARYDYAGEAEYFGLQALYENSPGTVSRVVSAAPSGASYAVYFADRHKLSQKTVFEWGLRWDDQTYTDLSSDSQLSPRINVLRSLGERTELRFSWGRYHQSQGIHELQVEDGVANFWPAQRADHLIAGVTHKFLNDTTLRIEAFHKDMQHVRPRFENLYDPLGLVPELQPDRIQVSPRNAKSKGLEISLDGKRDDWSWWASYTLSKTTDSIVGLDVVRSWDQRHAVQAGLSWSSDGWDVGFAAGAHTGWPTTDLQLEQQGIDSNGEPVYVAVPGVRNALRYSNFASLDFRLSRRFDVPRGSLLAFVEVSNLSNRRNVCCRDWDTAVDSGGSTVLEHSFDYWLPLLPAVGILWEF